MKKVLNISLGERSFAIEEDAYWRMNEYLEHFRARLAKGAGSSDGQTKEVMEDLESRIAELFTQEVGTTGRVVQLPLVERVTSQLGMPDGAPEAAQAGAGAAGASTAAAGKDKQAPRKIYRDFDNRRIAGVCAGIALYLDVDVVLVRILMLVALFAGSVGFWAYLICWIAIPKAETPSQKCEMNGLDVTAENMARFSASTSNNK